MNKFGLTDREIIENFILYAFSDDKEREQMFYVLTDYLEGER